jgi:hypothetical protein
MARQQSFIAAIHYNLLLILALLTVNLLILNNLIFFYTKTEVKVNIKYIRTTLSALLIKTAF